ncbi:MAG: hypothetical protein AB1696_11565 [Planctomycetota bacterium]
MKKTWLVGLSLLSLCAVAALAEDLTSGLQVGERTAAFQVHDVTGPNKGKALCYI